MRKLVLAKSDSVALFAVITTRKKSCISILGICRYNEIHVPVFSITHQ